MPPDSAPDPQAHEEPQRREQRRLLADLDRSWEVVQQQLLRDLAVGEDGLGLADSIRHALLRASIVRRGAPGAAAPRARSAPEEMQRTGDAPTSPEAEELGEREALRTLLGAVSLLDRQQKAELLPRRMHHWDSSGEEPDPSGSTAGLPGEWAAVLAKEGHDQNRALRAFVGRVSPAALPSVLEWAAANGDEWFLVRALYELAKRAAGVALQRRLLDAALGIADTEAQGVALEILAPILEGEAVAPAVAAVLALPSGHIRADLLYLLAPQIAGELLTTTIATVLALPAEPTRRALLAVLAPRLHGHHLHQVLQALRGAQEQAAQLELLAALAGQFDFSAYPDLLPAIAQVAVAAPAGGTRLQLLAATAAQVPEPRRGELCNHVVAGLWQGLPVDVKVEALRTVGPYLDTEQLRRAVGMLALLAQEQGALLRALMPFLPPASLNIGLRLARGLEDPAARGGALVALLPYVDGQVGERVVREALDALAELWDAAGQSELICALAPYLDEDAMQVAVMRARRLATRPARARSLAVLAACCAGTRQRDLVDEALAAALAIRAPSLRCETLIALAGTVEDTAMRGAGQRAVSAVLAALPHLTERPARAAVAAGILPFLPASQRSRVMLQVIVVLGIADGGLSPDEVVRVLSACVPYLDDTWLVPALAAVRRLEDPLWRARGFAALLACRSHSSRQLVWLHVVQDIYTFGRTLPEAALYSALATPGLLAPPQVTGPTAAALAAAVLALARDQA